MKIFALLGCLLLSLFAARSGLADERGVSLPIIYVDQFQPAAKSSGGFGPLHAIKSGLHSRRVDENAAALSHALVTSLSTQHFEAKEAPSKLPPSGWLLRGIFYSLDEGGHVLSLPFLSTRKSPDVEVTVTLADIAKDPLTPFAVIGTESVLKGQGAPLGWNPYVVGARFVVHKIEGDTSLKDLADQIAQKVAQQAADLTAHAAAQP